MTDEELTTLDALASAATAGPWQAAEGHTYRDGRVEHTESFVRLPGGDVALAEEVVDPATGEPSNANAAFIAASREAVPALIAEVRRLRGALGYSEQRVTMLRAELSEALDESRQALDALHTRCDALEGAAREYLAALDARSLAASLRDGVPVYVSVRGEPWDTAYVASCERVTAAAVVLRAAVGEVTL